jgi:uncharacterized membrane protein
MNDASKNLWLRLGTSRWLASRRQRRGWVVATYVGWLVIAGVVRLLDIRGAYAPRTIVILLLANSMAQLLWLGRRGYISSPTFNDSAFDERIVQIKNHAFRRAYQVLSLSVVTAGVLTAAAVTAQPGQQGFADAFVIWMALLLLVALLPTTIVAWREPDLVEPEPPA